MTRLLTACFFFFLAIAGLFGQPDTFYVDTTGIDAAGRGTPALPARTIRYTIDSLADDNLTSPCVVRINPGSYLENATFVINNIGTDSVNTLTLEATDPLNPPELRTDDTTQSKMIRIYIPYVIMDHIRFATSSLIDGGGYRGTMGIYEPHVTIRNCAFYKNPAISSRLTFRRAISFGQSYTKIQNCLFYGSNNQSIVLELSGAFEGIEITNNVFIERPSYRPSGTWNGSQVGIAFWSGADGSTLRRSKIWNNIFYGLPAGAFDWVASTRLDVEDDLIWYNMFWGNSIIVDNAAGMDIMVDTVGYNFKEQPLVVDTCLEGSDDGTAASLDLHLYRNSPAIDRGNPRSKDPDGGRADIGRYGGLEADTLAPVQLDTLIVLCNTASGKDTLIWQYASPPADFDQYAVYRDASSPIFVPGPGNIIDSITSSATTQAIYDNGGTEYYYKVNVWDDDTLGGGYKMFDTIPPYIGTDSIFYYSNGTVDPTDDTIVILLNEPVIDPFVFSVPADSYFVLTGLGNLSTCSLSTGSYPNDDTVVIYGFSDASHILCHERSWLGFKDASVWTDYVYNEGEQGDSVRVTTYNVANKRTRGTYQTIGAAVSDALSNDSILVIDAGLYREDVDLDSVFSLIGYGYKTGGSWITQDSMPVVMSPGSGSNLLIVRNDCWVEGIRFVVPASGPAVGQMLNQDIPYPSGIWDQHNYKRCVFMGNKNTSGWDTYSSHYLIFTADSCDFSGFTGRMLYSRTRERTQTFKNCRIHDMNAGAIQYYSAGRQSQPQYFANNIFYNIGGDAAISLRQSANVYTTGNLFYRCRGAYTEYNENAHRNVLMFNTVVGCTLNAFTIDCDAGANADTVKYNIVWGSGGQDMNSNGNPLVCDYNWFTGWRNWNWTPGAHSDSGYPVFADTIADNYRLDPISLCLDFTDFTDADGAAMGLTALDLDGNARSMPAGSYWDAGAYEGMLGPPRVDSVKSWCAGTETVGDDSITVYFRRPVEDDSLDTGAGNAENTFTLLGRGDISNATLGTGGAADDNIVVIYQQNADSILCHLLSSFALQPGAVYDTFNTGSQPTRADTDLVVTHNVLYTGTGTLYPTILEGYEAADDTAWDTVLVFDDGLYIDTLHVEKSVAFLSADGKWPVIGAAGTGTATGSTMVYLAVDDQVLVEGFEIDGLNGQADTIHTCVVSSGEGLHTIRNNRIYSARYIGINVSGTSRKIIQGNDIYDLGYLGINNSNTNGNTRVWENTIHDIYQRQLWFCAGMDLNPPGGAGMNGQIVQHNVFYNVNGSYNSGIWMRDINDVVIRNNLFYNNGIGIHVYTTGICSSISIINNTCVNNNNGSAAYNNGIRLGNSDDYGHLVLNNLLWGNTGDDLVGWGKGLPADSIRYNWLSTYDTATVNTLDSNLNTFGTDGVLADPVAGDLHLRLHSPAIDRADTAAAWQDYDGSRGDCGAYGGPNAIDTLQPRVPDGPLTVTGNKEAGYTHDTLSWSPYAYSRGDFALYAVYRDTFSDFVPVEANCVDSLWDSTLVTGAYANNGKDYVYKLSVANDNMYGIGYITGTYARIYQLKTSDRYSTVPGDTVTYTLYYDNDGETASNAVFSVIDYLPARTVYLDTLSPGLHNGGTVDVDWYNGTAWQETEPAAGTVRAVRWEIQPGIGAQSGIGDASGVDLTKSGVDTTQGTDSGWVRFRVVVQ